MAKCTLTLGVVTGNEAGVVKKVRYIMNQSHLLRTLSLVGVLSSSLSAAGVDADELRASHGTINKTAVAMYDFRDQSNYGMQWSPQNIADVGKALRAASKAVAQLHAQFPSAVADAYGNGMMTNIDETFKLFGAGNLERGCISHQTVTFNAVQPVLGGSSLAVRKIWVIANGVFPHNAVIIYPKDKDWKRSGLVLDAWKRQKSDLDKMVYRFNAWQGPVDFGAKLLPEG